MRTQATTVVNKAPTAMGLKNMKNQITFDLSKILLCISYQKSFGVPSQVRGVKAPATINIIRQRSKLTPTSASKD